jgi:hypothetical protein
MLRVIASSKQYTKRMEMDKVGLHLSRALHVRKTSDRNDDYSS